METVESESANRNLQANDNEFIDKSLELEMGCLVDSLKRNRSNMQRKKSLQ